MDVMICLNVVLGEGKSKEIYTPEFPFDAVAESSSADHQGV